MSDNDDRGKNNARYDASDEEMEEEDDDLEFENSDENEDQMEEDDDLNSEILPFMNEGTNPKASDKITPRFLTKYEKARIIGTRALQISKNSPIFIDIGNGKFSFIKDTYDPIEIAEKELLANKIPFIIRRYLPDGSFEDWNVNDLIRLD